MDWEPKTIDDICDFVGGSQPPKSEFAAKPQKGYVRLIQIRDYKTNDFITYISEESTSKFCDKDDVMIGRYGPPIFQICRGIEGAYNVALMKAVPKPGISRDYVYYLLKQDSIHAFVEKLSLRTSGQTGVDIPSLKKYPVLLPPPAERKRIVGLLSALDRKIRLNEELISELTILAGLLYEYWFVQFDFPMTSELAQELNTPLTGMPYRASGGKMTYNKELKRDIPAGWKTTDLESICKRVVDTVNPADVASDTPYVALQHVPRRRFFLDDWDVAGTATSTKTRFEKDDILFGKLRPYFHKVVRVAMDGVCTSELLVLRSKQEKWRGILGSILFSDTFVEYTSKKWGGAQMPRADWDLMQRFRLPLPTDNLLVEFNRSVQTFWSLGDSLQKQNNELAEMRNWLLPLLINGQVKVD